MKRTCNFKKIIALIKEYRYDFEPEYHRHEFVIRIFLAWFFNLKCSHCDFDGMSGYWEREVCCWCNGFHLRWQGTLRDKIRQFIYGIFRDKNWESRYYRF